MTSTYGSVDRYLVNDLLCETGLILRLPSMMSVPAILKLIEPRFELRISFRYVSGALLSLAGRYFTI